MWQSGILALQATFGRAVAKGQKKSATSCGEIADAERLTSFCSDGYWAVAHAAGGSEGSQGCREDADDDLQDGLPSFSVLHGVRLLRD